MLQIQQLKQLKNFLGYKPNIPIRKSWGQNFIVDNNTINKIISIIEPKESENLIEIGPGRGAITIPISKQVKHLTAIEIDPMLVEYLENFKIHNLDIIHKDFLKWEIKGKEKCRVIGNLPYYISSPIIFKLIQNKYVNEIIIMVQKELAQRLSANPNNKNYSRMSVVVQAFCDVSYECDVSKNIFNPKPKVESSIVRLKKKGSAEINFEKFSNFIKMCFVHRRKKLKNNLIKNAGITKNIDFLNNERPENLSVQQYIDLFNKFSF